MSESTPRGRPLWSLLIPIVGYLLLFGALIFWVLAGLDRITLELTQQLAEAVGLEGSSLDLATFERLRLGVLVFGGLSLFLSGGAAFFYHSLTRHQRDRFATAFQKALEGVTGDAEKDSSGLPFEFDGTVGSMRRAGKALGQQQRRADISRSRLSRLTNLLDVGVVLFNAGREPELASVPALRMLGEEGKLPSPEMTARIFKAFKDGGAELPDKGRAELELQAPLGPKRLRLQLFHLDEACDHGFLVLLRDQQVLEALDTDFRLATQLRVLSRLYMGVAHDLKAPLNAIGLNLAVLRSSFQPGAEVDDDKRRQCIAVVEEELARLQREVERLLAQTAPSREDVSRYDLRHVLGEIRDLLAPQARQNGTEVELNLPKRPAWVRGREDLAKQALLNVAMNALEAADGRVGLLLKIETGRAFVCITDDGDGMPVDHLDHIFEIHFTTKEHGTGIGLYIAQSILEAEGGTLVLKETSEAGTVFEASLPLEADPSPEAGPAEEEERPPEGDEDPCPKP